MNPWLDPVIENYKRYFGDCEKPVVWDVGSRDGDDAVELATRIYTGSKEWFWSNVVIVALEPNPDQVDNISKKYPEIEVLKLAASNKSSNAPFRVYEGGPGAVGSSSLNLDWKKADDLKSHVITVEVELLDNLIGNEIIDIMKVDVEGHSVEVLEGLSKKLNQVRVMHIETETQTGSEKKVKDYMKSRGWTLVDEREQYGGMPDQTWVNSGLSSE